jgi:hypothetical protein
MNIAFHIERLVLDGLDVELRDRSQLQRAVEAELTRLLAAGGLRPELLSGGAMHSIAGAEIRVPPQTTGAQLGYQIAHAVHGGIGAETVSQRFS